MDEGFPKNQRKQRNFNEWAQTIDNLPPLEEMEDERVKEKQGREVFVRGISEPREKGLLKMEEMGLPQPKRIFVPAVEFLRDPGKYLKQLDSKRVYVSVNHRRNNTIRHRTSGGIPVPEAIEFVKEKLSTENPLDYDILGLQFFENAYGGNIIINPEGRILIEFHPGMQGPVAAGIETPKFSVWRDDINGLFKYSFEDATLRQEIYMALLLIPHEGGEGRDMKFTPGYYEFALVRRDGGDEKTKLHPWFFDYKSDKAYYTRNV